jgi:hypothetical protein
VFIICIRFPIGRRFGSARRWRQISRVLLACLAKRPEDRSATAHVLRERLRACAAAGGWTNARAAQWWTAHRHQLRSGGAEPSAASAAGDVRSPHLTVTRITD